MTSLQVRGIKVVGLLPGSEWPVSPATEACWEPADYYGSQRGISFWVPYDIDCVLKYSRPYEDELLFVVRSQPESMVSKSRVHALIPKVEIDVPWHDHIPENADCLVLPNMMGLARVLRVERVIIHPDAPDRVRKCAQHFGPVVEGPHYPAIEWDCGEWTIWLSEKDPYLVVGDGCVMGPKGERYVWADERNGCLQLISSALEMLERTVANKEVRS